MRTEEDQEAFARLRSALAAADFTVERVEDTLATQALSGRRTDTLVLLERLGDDGFGAVARLFLLGLPIGRKEAESVFAPLGLDRLSALGLARLDEGQVVPEVTLVPHGEYYIASDRVQPGAEPPQHFVAGIQGPSVMLAKLAVRRAAGAALDLGTGCGIQALLAAKHSERVVATDLNPRALDLAALNARLNGIDRIELRHGDGFEAVAGERFDLIVSNPPYVISPGVDYLYRDNALPADELSRRLVEAAPRHLNEGGFAHFLVSWVESGHDWAEAVRPWVEGRGCDAWLLHYKTEDAVTHAANWLSPLAEDPARFEREFGRWLRYLGEEEIESIGYGAIVLRRRAGANWIHTDSMPLERLAPASDHTLRVFAAQDLLRRLPDDRSLLDARLILTEGHRLEQTLRAEDGQLVVVAATLELLEGLAFRVGIDRYTTALLPRLDGSQPLAAALEAAALDLDVPAAEHEQFAEAALPVVRRLLELGFVEVAEVG